MIEQKIEENVLTYRNKLIKSFDKIKKSTNNNNNYYQIYEILGIPTSVSKYMETCNRYWSNIYGKSGYLFETNVTDILKTKYPDLKTQVKIENTTDSDSKYFLADCMIGNSLFEIKYRDTNNSTYFGKQKIKVQSLNKMGYDINYLIFFDSNDIRTEKNHNECRKIIGETGGQFLEGLKAFEYINDLTNVDYKCILDNIRERSELIVSPNFLENLVQVG